MVPRRLGLLSYIALAAILATSPSVLAELQNGAGFNSEGPGPAIGARGLVASGDKPPGGTVTGAIEAIAVDPSNPKTIFVGAVDGGIWKTTDGGTSWTPLIDQKASISISSIALDPTDATRRTVIAGTGDISNGAFVSISNFSTPSNFGGLQNGLLYSQDGGATWSRLGAAALSGQSVVNVAARGTTILAATFEPRVVEAGASFFTGALYRSTNSGGAFTAVSGTPGTGLPAGPVTSLVGDPANPNKFYAAVTASSAFTKAQTAVYSSIDGGATWIPVFTAVNSGGLINGVNRTSLKLAAGPGGTLAVGLVNIATRALTGLFYSSNNGSTWTTLTTPNVTPGHQAPVNIALAIDPSSPNLIYVEGDDDFLFNGGISALAIARVNATTNTATPISDDNGAVINTGNGSAVHPDGRVLMMDSNGSLLTGTDGGIYARTSPQNSTGIWEGLNGNIVATEVYAAAFDSNSKRMVVSAQDNGSSFQAASGSQTYNQRGAGDGINVAINDKTLGNRSAIYTSSQSLMALQRFVVDQTGTIVSPESGPPFAPGVPVNFNMGVAGVQFFSPFVLNNVDPTRIAVAGTSVYVTQDTLSGAVGPTATAVNLTLTNLGASGVTIQNIDYGTRNNPNALITGGGIGNVPAGNVFLSTTATAGSLTAVAAYAGLAPTSVKFDQRSDQRFFVADSQNLYGTANQGATFQRLTSDLPPNFIRPSSLSFVDNNGVEALLIGGLNNIDNAGNPLVVADSNNAGILTGWRRFGSSLPNTTIDDLSYNPKSDALAVTTVGRGAYLIYDFTSNFSNATVLQFGLADNDSNPDPAILFGNRPLVKYGIGTLTINGRSTYTGTSTVLAGTMAAGAENVFAPNSAFTVSGGATLNLASFDQVMGSVAGSGNVTLGSATLTTGSDNTSTFFSGAISGSGGLTKIGSGALLLTGVSTYTGPTNVGGGVLDVNGSLASTVAVNSGAMLMGSGMIGGLNVGNGGTVAPGNSIGTLNVSGNVTFAAGSTYQLEINAAGQSDKIIATGTATLSGGTVQVLAANGAYSSSTRYTILTANGGVSGTFAELTATSNLAFLSPTLSYDASDVFLGFAAAAIFPSVAVTRNQGVTAVAVQALGSGNSVFNAVAGQSVGGAQQAFDALSGEIHASAVTAAFEDQRLPREAILDRLGHPLDAPWPGVASTMTGAYVADFPSGKGPPLAPVGVQMYKPRLYGLWGQGFGDWGKTDSDHNAAKLTRNTGGLIIGADAAEGAFGGIWRLGAAAGHTDDSLKAANRLSSGDYHSIFAALYGGASFGAVDLKAGVIGASTEAHTSRSIAFPLFSDVASSSYGGTAAQAFAEAGYRLPLRGSLWSYVPGLENLTTSYEPFLQAAVIHIGQDRYAETALTLAGLIGTARGYDLSTTTLGLRSEFTLQNLPGFALRTMVGWRHAFGDLTPSVSQTFAGTFGSFTIAGVPIARDAYVTETTIDYSVSSTVTVGLSYSGQFGQHTSDNAFKGTAQIRF